MEEDAGIGDIKEVMRKCCLSGKSIEKYLKEYLQRWKTMPVKIAIIGMSGSGKSTFINAIRGLNGLDKGAAKIGGCMMSVTTEIKEYVHPGNSLIRYYDLPGVGTKGFEESHYLDTIQFKRYDAFVFLTKDRFLVTDDWLMKRIQKEKKIYFAAVTQMDVKSDNYKHDNSGPKVNLSDEDGRKLARQQTIDEVKELLPDLKIGENLFLICTRPKEVNYWDLADLKTAILKALPLVQCEALILSTVNLTVSSQKYVDKVTVTLRDRVWKMAVISGIAGLIPILGLKINISRLKGEILRYFKVYGLDFESVEKRSKDLDVSLQQMLHESGMDDRSSSFLQPLFGSEVKEHNFEDRLKLIVKKLIHEKRAEIDAEISSEKSVAFFKTTVTPRSFFTIRHILNSVINELDAIAKTMESISRLPTSKEVHFQHQCLVQ